MLICSIKNEKLSFFNRPIYVESHNEALTYIQNVLMSDADRALLGLKNDLALYCLGEVDFVSGKIDSYKKPMFITSLVDIFDSVPSEPIHRSNDDLLEKISVLADKIKILEERGIC